MTTILTESYLAALSALDGGAPRDLLKRAAMEAEDRDPTAHVGLDLLARHLVASTPNDPLRGHLHRAIAKWDSMDAAEAWTDGTAPQTDERRRVIYKHLAIDSTLALAFDQLFAINSDGTVVISTEFKPWYTPERRRRDEFYWPAYSRYLSEVSQWPADSIAALDDATTKVVQRLDDPYGVGIYQSRGLVIGYVQSGKTANFTGVISKAIDAGYRLVIVLTGTVELLREQTQRRLDMELVGKENILRGVDPSDADLVRDVDYYHTDDAWDGKFISHGVLPSTCNYSDIIRLTRHRFDYKSLKAGVVALEYYKAHRSKPLYDRSNLPTADTRLMVVKKNKSVLEKLTKDLKSIKGRLNEIPALIIDDESDQASVNTSNPAKWQADTPERQERTAINGLISQLLELLPRAQYVGYTATPFANVFIDPSDVEDIFPKDFLVSLDRPPNYMGVADFHDLDPDLEDVEKKTYSNSKEKAHVRSVSGQGPDRVASLTRAIDAFVLSGAIKLYREANSEEVGFRHHTMLVHESVKTIEHQALADEIADLWNAQGYSSPAGLEQLKELYVSDFLPVCQARPDGIVPPGFDDLRPHIAQTIARITEHSGNPVIIVNGDKDMAKEDVAFDKRRVWRILVGGTKLSRGFTVEGLTVSYYRRTTKQADTLMQMGRWFGFRRHYKDLVRLYIGRSEPYGRKTIDLYEAFEAIVRDEEAFRDQLRKYSEPIAGEPQVTPRDIPPLVSQHLPWLQPAARNKMFNAKLVVRRDAGSLVIPTGYAHEPERRARNYDRLLRLMTAAHEKQRLIVPEMPNVGRSEFDAWMGSVSHDVFENVLGGLEWITSEYYAPEIEFIRELGSMIDEWVVILPQLDQEATRRNLPSVGRRSVFKRGLKPNRNNLWGEPTDRKHRPAAQRIVGAYPDYGDRVIEGLRSERRGAILLYPMCETPENLPADPDPSALVIGTAWITPAAVVPGNGRIVQFVTRNKEDEQAAIIDATAD